MVKLDMRLCLLAQGSYRLEKYLNIQDYLEKSLKIKLCLEKYLKNTHSIENSLNFTFYRTINTVFGDPNQYKLVCLYLVQHMLHQIKSPQFHTNFLKLISLEMQSSISKIEF